AHAIDANDIGIGVDAHTLALDDLPVDLDATGIDEHFRVATRGHACLSENFLQAFAFGVGILSRLFVFVEPICAQITCYGLGGGLLITLNVLTTGRFCIRQQNFAVTFFLFRCAVSASGWGHGVVSFSLKLYKLDRKSVV